MKSQRYDVENNEKNLGNFIFLAFMTIIYKKRTLLCELECALILNLVK